MQLIYLVLALTLGLLLAQHFRAFILLPTILLVAIVPLAGGFTGTDGLAMRGAVAVMAVVSLQFGYLLGLGAFSLWSIIHGNRAVDHFSNSSRRTHRPAHSSSGDGLARKSV